MPPVLNELGLLNLLALGWLLGLVVAWARHQQRRRLAISGLIAVSAIVSLYGALVHPSDIPIDWVTIIHHSLGRKTIMHLYGRGVHAGPNFNAVFSPFAAGEVLTMHDVVWLNLLLALVNASIFLHLGLAVTSPVWAVAWTLVLALNPATFLASFSELPTNLLGLYLLAGFIAWAVVIDPLPRSRWLRAAAYGLCALLTLLAGLTRSEVASIGIVALGLHGVHALVGSDRWARAREWSWTAGERVLALLSARPGLVVVLTILGVAMSQTGIPHLVGRSELAGVYPFNPSILSLFLYLPMLLLPIGVSLAIGLGFVHTLVHFVRFGGLALSLLMLVRAYFAAQYEYFEMGRYMSYILPAIFLLGLFGREQLARLTSGWSSTWRRSVYVLYIMAWCPVPLPGIPDLYLPPEVTRSGGFSQFLLDLNTQHEVRHLMALTENNPECVFVGRVVIDQGDPKYETKYSYLLFGGPVPYPISVPESDARLDDVIARYAPNAACVRLYYGGDCNLNYSDRCREFIAGRRLVDEHRFWSRPYNNPRQSGYGAPEIVLATYAWP